MKQWHTYAGAALAVGLFAALPAAAQPGPGGGSVKEIEAELNRLRDRTKSLEARLATAKEKAKPSDKGRPSKGEKDKHDGKGRHRFGRGHGPRGPMHGFGRMHRSGGMRGPRHGFGPWGHLRGKEGPKGGKGEQAPKGKGELRGTARSKEAAKSGGSSALEQKLDRLQKDLEEIRRELKRR